MMMKRQNYVIKWLQILYTFRFDTSGVLGPRELVTDIFTYLWVLTKKNLNPYLWLRGRLLEPSKNCLRNSGKNANHHYITKFYIWVEIQISHKNLKICLL